jgi:hypothetical protein
LSPTQNDGLIAAPDYFGSDVRIDKSYTRHYDYLATVFGGTGVRPAIANHGLDVLDQMGDMEPPGEQQAAHSYDVSRFGFRSEDLQALTYFLNRMSEKGATQAEVNSFLTLYRDAERAREKRAAMNAGKTDLQRKAANSMSLEEIRQVMKTDRRRYTRDEAMQQRYRDLLRTTQG